jgi:hypothetical protein
MQPTKSSLPILYSGNCEPLKAAFHGLAMVLAATMGAYNTAAWIRRRESHLAVNAVIYMTAVFWEQRHVAHHLCPCLPSVSSANVGVDDAFKDGPPPAKAA